MPKINIETVPKRPAPDPDGDRDDSTNETPLLRAKNFLTGRTGEKRDKKRNRAPRNILGRRG